jgi:hypothetical protein
VFFTDRIAISLNFKFVLYNSRKSTFVYSCFLIGLALICGDSLCFIRDTLTALLGSKSFNNDYIMCLLANLNMLVADRDPAHWQTMMKTARFQLLVSKSILTTNLYDINDTSIPIALRLRSIPLAERIASLLGDMEIPLKDFKNRSALNDLVRQWLRERKTINIIDFPESSSGLTTTLQRVPLVRVLRYLYLHLWIYATIGPDKLLDPAGFLCEDVNGIVEKVVQGTQLSRIEEWVVKWMVKGVEPV